MSARRGGAKARRALWLDGVFVAASDARVSPFDPSWRAGIGLFESFCVGRDDSGRALARFDAHRARLTEAAPLAGCQPVPDLDWAAVFSELLDRAGLDAARGRVSLRPREARPRLVALVEELEDLHLRRARGLRLATSPFAFGPQDPSSGLKLESRFLYERARAHATLSGADDALLVGPDGELRETTRANIFLRRSDGALVTPALDGSFLPGVARAGLLRALHEAGDSVSEVTVRSSELRTARAVFLTNGVVGVEPVREIDGRAVEIGSDVDRCLLLLRRTGMPC